MFSHLLYYYPAKRTYDLVSPLKPIEAASICSSESQLSLTLTTNILMNLSQFFRILAITPQPPHSFLPWNPNLISICDIARAHQAVLASRSQRIYKKNIQVISISKFYFSFILDHSIYYLKRDLLFLKALALQSDDRLCL